VSRSLDELKAEAAAKLPASYERLILAFYGLESQFKGGYLIIGEDSATELCLNPASGEIQAIDPLGEMLTRFMNSSIEQLAEFIAIYDRLVVQIEVDENTDLEPQLNQLRESFLAIDQAALAGPEHWWSTILEQLELEM
jgi:hypothetical protein